MKRDACPPSTGTYTLLINLHGKHMGCEPDKASFNIMVDAYGRAGLQEDAQVDIISIFILVEDHIKLSPYLSYLSGAVAGCAATVGSYPFDLLRTILASQGEPKVYPTMRSAFIDIIRTRGFRGLYAGLSPTLVEIVPYAGIQFGTYDTFKRWTMTWNCHRSSITSSTRNDDSLSSF